MAILALSSKKYSLVAASRRFFPVERHPFEPRIIEMSLPSLFTTGNVFCGFYAFVAVLNENFYHAAWAISVGMIFDGLDGRIARLTKTTSAFGMQYDSLADIITFGMAPAFLAYAWVLKPFGRLGWMAAFLFLLCAALRLARFNVTKTDISSTHFTGEEI